ncbi:hypothetical protein CEP53_000755 [Fusarium sp. AF-6]|nr:hypothetical protein CEP53_000755 [Fusarium sp. AF-6]
MSSGEAPPVNPAPSRPRGIPPHREWESFETHNWGVFNTPWVGENPTIEGRRAYMGVYLNWMVEGSAESEKRTRKKAEEAATIKFAQEGKTEVKTTIFEWAVDRIYWDIWFEDYSSIAGQPPEQERQRQQRQQQRQQQQSQGVRRRRAGSFEEPQSSQRRRLEAPAREDVVFLTAMNQILSDSFGLRCVNDQDWNMNLLRYLIPHFVDRQSRQRLYSLLEEGPMMAWYCLRSIFELGYRNSIPNSGLCRCTDHMHPRHFVCVWDVNGQGTLVFETADT